MIGVRRVGVVVLPVLIIWTSSCAGNYLVFTRAGSPSQNLSVLCTIFKCIHFVSLNRIKWRAQRNYTCIIRSRDMMDFTPANRSPLKKKTFSLFFSKVPDGYNLKKKKVSRKNVLSAPPCCLFSSHYTPTRCLFVVTELSVVPVGRVTRSEDKQVPEAGVLLATACHLRAGGN